MLALFVHFVQHLILEPRKHGYTDAKRKEDPWNQKTLAQHLSDHSERVISILSGFDFACLELDNQKSGNNGNCPT